MGIHVGWGALHHGQNLQRRTAENEWKGHLTLQFVKCKNLIDVLSFSICVLRLPSGMTLPKDGWASEAPTKPILKTNLYLPAMWGVHYPQSSCDPQSYLARRSQPQQRVVERPGIGPVEPD